MFQFYTPTSFKYHLSKILMTFTLTLLGTDTVYSPGILINAFDKAETLSYVSSLIPGEPIDVDEVTTFRNSNVAVVNGPKTFGREVGDRITRAVLAILEAISRGETNICIVAHSRGAVEAILVAHELERIKAILQNPLACRSEITNSVCPYTKRKMKELFGLNFGGLDLEKITNNIDGIQLSLFNVDPVPGGNYLGFTHATKLAWRDKRFYKLPKIVREYEQYICENERTRCFKVIVPKCLSPETIFKLHTLPGHHGTGSGNLKDQQRRDNPTGKTTEHAQQLMIVKIIDFLKRHDVTLRGNKLKDDPFAEITARLFDKEGQYSLSFEQQVKSLYLDLYDKIIDNKAGYDHFDTTSYATLGQEQGIRRRVRAIIHQRIVHYHTHNHLHLKAVIPPVISLYFLNHEHARIYLHKELNLETASVSFDETLALSIKRLLEICLHNKELKELKENIAFAKGASSAPNYPSSPHEISSKEGFELLLHASVTMIDEMLWRYLQDERTDLSHREVLHTSVKNAFNTLKNFTQTHPENGLAKIVLSTLNLNLKATLEAKSKALNHQYCATTKKHKAKKLIANMQKAVHKIHEILDEQDVEPSQDFIFDDLDTELRYQWLIRTKLTPITRNYLVHLAYEIKKTVAPDLVITNNTYTLIAEINSISAWPHNEQSRKLSQKFDAVSTLYDILEDKNKRKSREKIVNFYHKLDELNQSITMHRDIKWQRYTRNIAITLSIISTGILPGLVMLALFSAASNRSLKYWQSQGVTFFKTCEQKVENHVSSLLLNKVS
jgi:hypothetical protein